jgi:hypothetical protein
MYATPLDLALSDATVHLLESLTNLLDAQVLGPQVVQEISERYVKCILRACGGV